MRQQDVERVVARLSAGGAVVTLLGPPGIGRTWVLRRAAERLSGGGCAVRTATGSPDEAGVPFAGLHQLLHRDQAGVAAALPPGRRRALLGALAGEGQPGLPLGAAVLDALRHLAGGGPLLVAVDDAQWLDRPSLRCLAFAARRLAGEPVALLLAGTGPEPPEGFGGVAEPVRLAPLAGPEAARLLDALPAPPSGEFRAAVLAGAAGNPLALVELAALPPRSAGPLPPTPALAALAGPPLADAPPEVRAALAVLAVAGPEDLGPGGHGLGFEPAVWAGAERLGFVEPDAGSVRFPHPLARAAVHHALRADERRRAHRHWSGRLRALPHRAAWHRAAAASGPDDAAADALAACAASRGDAAAWELAAALTTDPGVALGRVLAALSAASAAGDLPAARRLLADVRRRDPAAARDPAVAVVEQTMAAVSGRPDPEALLALAAHEPRGAVAAAVGLGYHLGDPGVRRRVRAAADELPPGAGSLAWWAEVGTGAAVGEPARARLHALARERPGPGLAAAAWLLDEPLVASRLAELRPDGTGQLALWAWAQLDLGRWDDAADGFERSLEAARTREQPLVEGAARTGLAHLAAARGDRAEADAQALAATRAADPAASRAIAVRAAHAQGLAALAAGDGAAAWAHLSRAVGPGGDAAHFHASAYAVADLVEAALRTGRAARGQGLVGALLDGPGAPVSARVRQLRGHAAALLAAEGGEAAAAGHWFAAALGEDEAERWPFERARLLLAHGRWLRRGRRVAQAREPLERAAVLFARLGAGPWLRATRQELRAAGVPAGEPPRLADLTATEWEIVRLAAAGLSNPEIAAKLVLSPRTVASHLYRSFPKLGVTARRQLRELVEGQLQSADG